MYQRTCLKVIQQRSKFPSKRWLQTQESCKKKKKKNLLDGKEIWVDHRLSKVLNRVIFPGIATTYVIASGICLLIV